MVYVVVLNSSVVEQSAVNRSVVGSSPTSGASGPFVKWLRHRPFTAGSRVRISHGSPWAISSAGRASALQAECRQFDPVIAHHKKRTEFRCVFLLCNHIINTIKDQLKQGAHAMKSARALYDGYNTTDNVVRKQMLPKYLQDVVNFSRRSDLTKNDVIALQKLVRKARRMVDRLAQNGAPNRALKTSYKELLDAVESCSDKALKRAIRTAVEEKSRYVAERIARTESARAWYQGFLKDTMDDPDVVAYRWVESTRHPTEDICDEYAKVDAYGLGPGIFPKDKAPELPAHPHCLCHYEKVYATELSVNLRLNNKAVVRRNVLFPFDETDAVGIPREITNKLAETFDSIEENYNIDKPVLISVEFLNNEKVPLQYQGLKIGNVISRRIVINSNFNWGNIDFINQKLQNAHDNGKLASKNVEGLAVHEMGHFLTYLDCDDEKKLFQREKDIRACYVEGVSLYSDTSRDGAECWFVKHMLHRT